GPGALRLHHGPLDGRAGPSGEPFEHQRLPYFLCTACRLTPSSAAISCQDQPWTRALRTCTASSCSSSRRSAATARSPTRGSRSPARAARSVASVIMSIYVDTALPSIKVDNIVGQPGVPLDVVPGAAVAQPAP